MTPKSVIVAVVGLGNPGERYAGTLHNAGFRVVDGLAKKMAIRWQRSEPLAEWGRRRRMPMIILMRPLTFMNRSGMAVEEMLDHFGISAAQMLVVHDDLDLPIGRMKIVPKGGSGGHKGVLSIIDHLGHGNFPRMKLGIGRPRRGETVEQYVLGEPYPEDRVLFDDMISRAIEAAQVVVSSGLETAMNRFNRRHRLSTTLKGE